MLKKRLIAVLIIRDNTVVQSVRFKHTNVIHADPIHAMETFNQWAVDEIVLLNVSREADSKTAFAQTVKHISQQCFLPVAVGGWITSEQDAELLLKSGADKLVINTAFYTQPELPETLSKKYGAQCIVASMDICNPTGQADQVCIDRGRQVINYSPEQWAQQVVQLGAGEILFNSIAHDGARRGYHQQALKQVCQSVNVPVIAFGGVFRWKHLLEGFHTGASAVAVANQFHYTEHAAMKAKRYLAEQNIAVRQAGQSAIS